MFVHYTMENTSTDKTTINNLAIYIHDTFTQEVIGSARMIAFTDIWIDLPTIKGRYSLRKPAIDHLATKGINTLADLYRYKWLISDGEWILKHLKKINGVKA